MAYVAEPDSYTREGMQLFFRPMPRASTDFPSGRSHRSKNVTAILYNHYTSGNLSDNGLYPTFLFERESARDLAGVRRRCEWCADIRWCQSCKSNCRCASAVRDALEALHLSLSCSNVYIVLRCVAGSVEWAETFIPAGGSFVPLFVSETSCAKGHISVKGVWSSDFNHPGKKIWKQVPSIQNLDPVAAAIRSVCLRAHSSTAHVRKED